MDPATTSGLALAVIPLIISAVEKYEYTFQPFLIFFYKSHYRKEVERSQSRLRIQHTNFENECFLLLLLLRVAFGPDREMTISELKKAMQRDEGLEERLKDRLDHSYDACLSALMLINNILSEVFQETRSLHFLMEKGKVSCRPSLIMNQAEWETDRIYRQMTGL